MRPRLLMAWCGLLAASGAGLAVAGRAAEAAAAEADIAQARLRRVSAQARELADLRALAPLDRKPGSGLAARVSAALTRAGLPTSALSSVSPESAFGEGANRRQRAVLILGAATLPQLGSFLQAWRSEEPDWVVSTIELSPQTNVRAAPGGDLPLRAVIGIETVYLERPAGHSGELR